MIQVLSAPGHVAAFHLAGTVTAGDYDRMLPRIEEKLERHEDIGVLADLTGLENMTGGAVVRDFQYGLGKLGEAHRVPACCGDLRQAVDQGGNGDDGQTVPADRSPGVPGG
jgi:hypothetical protein